MSDNNTPLTKADFQAGMNGIETRLKEYVDVCTDGVETGLKEYIDERTHDAETRLLRAFADYQQAQTSRFRPMKADLGNLNTASDERLAALEDRMTNVKKRLIEKHI